MTIVVTYDVSDDDRRARLAGLLQSWGDRVQYSVFVLSVTPHELQPLSEEMLLCIDTDRDSIHIFRQCHDCWDTKVTYGQGTIEQPPPYWIVL